MCGWILIRVGRHGGRRLFSTSLSGTLPESIGEMTGLLALDAHSTHLTGVGNISQLHSLRSLQLSNCSISVLPVLVPSGLTHLYLDANPINATIVEMSALVARLSKLHALSISVLSIPIVLDSMRALEFCMLQSTSDCVGTRVTTPTGCRVGHDCSWILQLHDADDQPSLTGLLITDLRIGYNCSCNAHGPCSSYRCEHNQVMVDNRDGTFIATVPSFGWVSTRGMHSFRFFHGDEEFRPSYDGSNKYVGYDDLRSVDFGPVRCLPGTHTEPDQTGSKCLCKSGYASDSNSGPTLSCHRSCNSATMKPGPSGGDCVCMPGYEESSGQNGTACQRCEPWALCPGGPNATKSFCPTGQQAQEGRCVACPAGKAYGGQDQCSRCPATTMPDSTAVSCQCQTGDYNASQYRYLQCVSSPVGFTDTDSVEGLAECLPCPPCATCAGGHSEPVLIRGFVELEPMLAQSPPRWRVAYQCDLRPGYEDSPNCPGGNSVQQVNESNGQVWSACAAGYSGYFCQSCAIGYHTVGHQCQPCASFSYMRLLLVATTLGVAYGVSRSRQTSRQLRLSKCFEISREPHQTNADSMGENLIDNPVVVERQSEISDACKLDESVHRPGKFQSRARVVYNAMFQPMRMVVTWAQITSQVGSVLNVHYPPMFRSAVQALSFLRDLSSIFFDAECVGLSGFVSQWLTKVVATPLMGVLGIVCIYLCRRRRSVTQAWRDTKSYLFGCTFLLYPMICNTAFAAFECRKLRASTSGVILEADDRMLCTDSGIVSLQLCSLVIIILFAGGVPLTFGTFLVHTTYEYKRSDVDTTKAVVQKFADEFAVDVTVADHILRDVTAMGRDYSFLMDAYSFKHYYWEVFDMLRKLLLYYHSDSSRCN
eukprot:COSAG02_NODE_6232_length_3710_cov_3.154528_3_plen_878_part_00